VHDRFDPNASLVKDTVDPGYADMHLSFMVGDKDSLEEKRRKFKWGHAWYKAAPVTQETFDELRMKIRCIMSESLLSVRARQLGADIRSPYDARSGRQRIRTTVQYFADKFWERNFKRRLLKS
jgi:hypothetical protein